jgi:glycosyltransferase involved in cell wall biosynthesis
MENRKTIYINARFLTQPITGVQRYGIEISLGLKKLLGNEVVFVTSQNVIHKDIAEALEAEVIGKRIGHYWEQFDLPRYLKAKGCPLLLNLANTAPIFYKNKISTIHDVAFRVYPKIYSRQFLWFYRVLIPRVLSSSKHIITVSEFSKKEIQKYYNVDESKISVIYNAVSENFTEKKNGTLSKEKYFLAVSSLNERKNFQLILYAFNELKQSYPEYSLYIIGDLKNRSFETLYIENYASEQIKFLGRASDVQLVEYYSNAYAFLYPSFYEGFGIPPLEAQACGCPIIVSNASCLPEIFVDSALYCDPFSIKSLGNKMIELITKQQIRSILIAKGFRNVERFSWERSCELLKIILKK